MKYSSVTFNLNPINKRYETLEGKQYLVVPAVSLTEGVHEGTSGKLLYKKEHYGKNPQTWNHKPIVIYHPQMQDGQGVSACSPEIIERQKTGLIFNSGCDDRLKHECWLDESKLRQLAPKVAEAVDNNQMVEISTGLYHDLEITPGTWNNQPYEATVVNIQPDHIAILPDQIGACSIKKGAGLLRNAAGCELSHNDVMDHLHEHFNGSPDEYGIHSTKPYSERVHVREVYPKHAIYEKGGRMYKHDYKIKDGKATPHGEPQEVRKQTSYVTTNGQIILNDDATGPLKLPRPNENELSDVMKKQQFQSALKEKYSGIQQEGDWGGWVTELYANYVIYSKDGKTFRLPYTYDDDKINFGTEPEEEVERVSEYRPKRRTDKDSMDGTQSPYSINTGQTMPQPTQNVIHQGAHSAVHSPSTGSSGHNEGGKSDTQQRSTAGGSRKDEVNKMIAGGHAKEEDRAFLEGLPDDNWKKVSSWVMKGATEPIQQYSYEGISDRSNAHTANQQQTVNAEDWINQSNMPPEVKRSMLTSLARDRQYKTQLVTQITSNQANTFNKDWLMVQDIPMLEGIARLATPTQNQQVQHPSLGAYGGQGDIPMFTSNVQQDPTLNRQQGQDQQMIFPLPSCIGSIPTREAK